MRRVTHVSLCALALCALLQPSSAQTEQSVVPRRIRAPTRSTHPPSTTSTNDEQEDAGPSPVGVEEVPVKGIHVTNKGNTTQEEHSWRESADVLFCTFVFGRVRR
eukprot:2851486-Pyramimonas_sp.AAC.2